ncbi:DUF7857 domain-containing protein [Halorubrum pallidum]
MDLTWTVEREGDASLVRCRVYNDEGIPRRVRLDSRLDGPVLPPRRSGVPEAGWDSAGVDVRLAPDESRAMGFAVPAEPVEPPVEIREVESVTDRESARSENGHVSPAPSESSSRAAVRDLGGYRPPRDVVVDRDTGRTGVGADAVGGESDDVIGADGRDGGGSVAGSQTRGCSPTDRRNGDRTAASDAVDEWLTAVADRVGRAERLTDADLATATAVVEEADGLAEVSDLDRQVAADAERLRTVSERTAALAARADAADVPIEALERLA